MLEIIAVMNIEKHNFLPIERYHAELNPSYTTAVFGSCPKMKYAIPVGSKDSKRMMMHMLKYSKLIIYLNELSAYSIVVCFI